MKINEVEQLLGVSKANIRFYEKQNLLAPARSENGYREYEDQDIDRLKDIIILRKLGIPVQEIGKIFHEELPLQDAIQSNIKNLEQQLEQLNGALQLSRQIERENLGKLDTQRYWDTIQQQEAAGVRFAEMMSDYWDSIMKPALSWHSQWIRKLSNWKVILIFLAMCTVYALSRTFLAKEGVFWINLLYWPSIILIVVLITLPLWLLGHKFPRVISWVVCILTFLCVGFLTVAVILAIIGGFVAIFDAIR